MKRVIISIGWLVIINFVLNFIGGFVAGFMGSFANPPIPGAQAGIDFTQKYGWLIFIASVLIVVIGTVTEKLPYTKKG